MFCVVYFYGGVAKIQMDWLFRAEPLFTWFFKGSHFFPRPLIGKVVGNEELLLMVSFGAVYFSFFVDLFGSFLHLFPRTRSLALFLSVLFHLLNSQIFRIETFPLTMIVSSVLWLEPQTCQKIFPFSVPLSLSNKKSEIAPTKNSCFLLTALIFLIIQLLLPLRPYLLSQDPNWTNEGSLFSWRMMLNQEDTLVKWLVKDNENKEVPPRFWSIQSSMRGVNLTDYVREQLKQDPLMIQDFSHSFAVPFSRSLGLSPNISVFVEAWRSLNGRPFQRWIDPNADLLLHSVYPWQTSIPWLLPRLKDVNSMEFLSSLPVIQREWERKGYELLFFSDSPGGTWEGFFQPFAHDLFLVSIKGEILLELDGQPNKLLQIGKEERIPFEQYHALTNQGKTSSTWFYAWKKPAKIPFSRAILMD